MKNIISAVAISCALLSCGCVSEGDLYTTSKKDNFLTTKEATSHKSDAEIIQTDTTFSDSSVTIINTSSIAIQTTAMTAYDTEIIDNSHIMFAESLLNDKEQKIYNIIYDSLSKGSDTVSFDYAIDLIELKKIINYLIEDHPELFMLDSSYSTTSYTNHTDISFHFINDINTSNYFEYKQQLEKAVNNILLQIPENSSTYEKILLVHDIIVNSTDYAIDYAAKTYEESAMYYNAYGCLVNHYSVCDGYSKAFKLIMDRLGIRCGRVSGESAVTMNGHAWNYVVIDDDYYWIDVTWDDPISDNPDNSESKLMHTYFCISDEQLLRDHIIDTNESVYVPLCTATTYNYLKQLGCYMDEYSFDVFNRLFTEFAGNITVQFGSVDAYYAALSDLVGNSNIYNTDFMKKNDIRAYTYSQLAAQYALSFYIK